MVLHSVSTWLTLNVYLLHFLQIHIHNHLYLRSLPGDLVGTPDLIYAKQNSVFPTKNECPSVSGIPSILVARVKILELMPDFSFSDVPHQTNHVLSALPSKHIPVHELRDRSMELNIKYRNWLALKGCEQNQKIHDKLWDNICSILSLKS